MTFQNAIAAKKITQAGTCSWHSSYSWCQGKIWRKVRSGVGWQYFFQLQSHSGSSINAYGHYNIVLCGCRRNWVEVESTENERWKGRYLFKSMFLWYLSKNINKNDYTWCKMQRHRARKTGCEFQLSYFLNIWPWETQFNFCDAEYFPKYKMKTITPPLSSS